MTEANPTQDQVDTAPTIGREQLLQVFLGAGVGQVPHEEPPGVGQVLLLLMFPERAALPGCGAAALWGTVGLGGLLSEDLNIASTYMKTGAMPVCASSWLSFPRVSLASALLLFRACVSVDVLSVADCSPGCSWIHWDLAGLGSAATAPRSLQGHSRLQEPAAAFWDLPSSPAG